MSVPTKKCVKCGLVRPLTEFYWRAESKDRHDTKCKLCKRRYRKKLYDAGPAKLNPFWG